MRPLLTPDEEADLLGVPVRTLADWRHRRIGPPWVRVGRHARYPANATDSWIADRTVTAAESP